MEEIAIENEIATLDAKNRAIAMKMGAFSAAGSTVGVLIDRNKKLGFWGKIGFFVAGGTLARLPMAFLYSEELTQNTTRIEQLQQQLEVMNNS